jgi:hypothetical protein
MSSLRFEITQEEYCRAWQSSIYSSFAYFVQLQKYSDDDLAQFIGNQMNDKDKIRIKNAIGNAKEDDLRHLFDKGHGLCTAFAILVAQKAERAYARRIQYSEEQSAKSVRSSEVSDQEPLPKSENFEYFDARLQHRLALHLSGVLIDSSARAAVQLRNEQEIKQHKLTYLASRLGEIDMALKYKTVGKPQINFL